MNFTIAGISLAVATALGGWAGQHWTAAYYEQKIEGQAREARERVDAANRAALNAAASYEGWKATQRPKTITTIREVERELKADPLCADKPLPIGLRDALTSAAAGQDQPIADGPMPAASTASAYHLGRPRDGLFRAIGGARGLPGATEGAR